MTMVITIASQSVKTRTLGHDLRLDSGQENKHGPYKRVSHREDDAQSLRSTSCGPLLVSGSSRLCSS